MRENGWIHDAVDPMIYSDTTPKEEYTNTTDQ